MKVFKITAFKNLQQETAKGIWDLKAKRKSIGSSKKGARDFENSPLFQRLACLYVTITENFERFQYSTLKQIYWKLQTLFKKLEHDFLVESNKTENALFPYNTKLLCQEPILRQAEWEGQNGPITKSEVILFFRKFWLSLKIPLKELIWCTNHLNVQTHTF